MNQNPYPGGGAPMARGLETGRVPAAAGESVVDENSDFNGRYHSNNNLRIEGRAQGDISCNGTLIIADQAQVKAQIQTLNVTISGEYEGDVQCEGRFVLMPSARVVGRVKAAILVIQEGALFSGEIRMLDPNAPAMGRQVPGTSARQTRQERQAASPTLGGILDDRAGNGRAPAETRREARSGPEPRSAAEPRSTASRAASGEGASGAAAEAGAEPEPAKRSPAAP
jgi:cytoskeletal protein CcmA (bactofilin family)